jgi:hypothetical protein
MLSDRAAKPVSGLAWKGERGAAQGAATDAAPQPPAPNTNGGLSVPELLPPFRKIEIGDGWSSSGTESNKDKGQAVGEERRSRNRKKDDSKAAKKSGGGESQGHRAGVAAGEPSDGGGPITTRRGVVTGRDVEVLRWVGRHGVVSTEQIAKRFWPAGCAGWTVRRRLRQLAEARLVRERRPGWRLQSKLWLATARGLRLTGVALRPARLIGWRLNHDLALVDLSEQLLSEIAGSVWLTERELMVGGWRTSLKLRRLPDGLLIQPDGRRFAVELEASRKQAERLRRIVSDYMPALRGPNALAGVIWYARPQLSAGVEHLRTAVDSLGLSWAFEVRTWEGG